MTLTETLRDATRDIHRQLDDGLDPETRIVSRKGYSKYLGSFHCALRKAWRFIDWELLEANGLGQVDRRRARYHSLSEDLRALGRDPGNLDRRGFRSGPGQSAACAYVLEGSSHGGLVILAAAERNAGPLDPGTTRFLRGHGPDTRKLWREFVLWLDELPFDPDEVRVACETAVEVFSLFSRELLSSSNDGVEVVVPSAEP